ncbi:MAG: class I SAM-dependent methyltransferase [Chloroflexi bacterium]|nr:class I SAM-dependent methyltransferase [Chloroflexota bacterium]
MAIDTRPTEIVSRSGHDWHSVDYVRDWIAQYDARADSRKAQFDLLADLIPHSESAAISILDVGAGWGPVSQHLLERFPAARVTLLDFSDVMLGEARSRLAASADRVRFVQGDLSQPGAVDAAKQAAGGGFDASVSSLCVHNLRSAERIAALYRELRAVTNPGGCFLNIDHMGSSSPLLQAVRHRTRVEQLRRHRVAETGVKPSFEEVEAALRTQAQERASRHGHGHADHGASLAAAGSAAAGVVGSSRSGGRSGGPGLALVNHLTWLSQAGFDAVECFWRSDRLALIGGYVEAVAP